MKKAENESRKTNKNVLMFTVPETDLVGNRRGT